MQEQASHGIGTQGWRGSCLVYRTGGFPFLAGFTPLWVETGGSFLYKSVRDHSIQRDQKETFADQVPDIDPAATDARHYFSIGPKHSTCDDA